MPRLRQVALVAADLEAACGALGEALGVGEPFADPGVAEFGLRNAVFAVGDTFIEVVSPVREGTTAGRYRARLGGDGGYMVLVQVDDTAAARARAAAAGVRIAWSIDLPDISGTHLHPGDLGGCLLSLDTPSPAGSWRWGGPGWNARQGNRWVTGLHGARIAAPDPGVTATRWGRVLDVAPIAPRQGTDAWVVPLDGGLLAFEPSPGGPDRLVGFDVGIGGEAGGGRGAARGATVALLGCEVRFVGPARAGPRPP